MSKPHPVRAAGWAAVNFETNNRGAFIRGSDLPPTWPASAWSDTSGHEQMAAPKVFVLHRSRWEYRPRRARTSAPTWRGSMKFWREKIPPANIPLEVRAELERYGEIAVQMALTHPFDVPTSPMFSFRHEHHQHALA